MYFSRFFLRGRRSSLISSSVGGFSPLASAAAVATSRASLRFLVIETLRTFFFGSPLLAVSAGLDIVLWIAGGDDDAGDEFTRSCLRFFDFVTLPLSSGLVGADDIGIFAVSLVCVISKCSLFKSSPFNGAMAHEDSIWNLRADTQNGREQ